MTTGHDELLRGLLRAAREHGATDIHFKPDAPAVMRVGGRIHPLSSGPLTPQDAHDLVRSLIDDHQYARLLQEKELDLSWELEPGSRYRVNCHFERGGWAASFRALQTRIPAYADLGLPPCLAEIAMKPRGLVLVTGPTGSGKTTTMAAMIGHINNHKQCTVVTIEDPIEYLHRDNLAYIRQREVGLDTRSFPEALRRALRQDPDVIVIGEMRDLDTISTALTAAETGHLVIATLHTNSAEATINRIIDVYPPSQQHQVRIQLAATIEAVIAQQLLPSADGRGVALAYELMLGVHAVRRLIREEKTYSVTTYLQSGKSQGMNSMDSSLAQLVRDGRVTYDEALARCQEPEEFRGMCGASAPAPAYGGA